ncbi:methyl-accepting chemotaxis protein [Pelomonas sp. APW6]|uniref:Methyl-accepting chemotaxis protein n=1 Tax=Roseateles subflavus TaxID=3053353 RepID=A0ABT7LL27_9BURK|nr:methyl-accepting chemotaxis protein [Pelomonas sp. APW6]MDL5033572.1 methyl-accepting chemotaxis protein [Pelomonas sp. APW6]
MSMSSLLRQFSIRLRMIGAIVMVLTLLLTLGSVGLFGMDSMRKQSDDILQRSVGDSTELTRLVHAFGDLRRLEKDMIINYEKPDNVKALRQQWEQSRDLVLKQAKALQHGKEAGPLGKLPAVIADYEAKARPVLQQLESGGYDNAAVADRMLAAAKDLAGEADKLVLDYQAGLQKDSAQLLEQSKKTQSSVFMIFVVVLIASGVVVVPLTLLNMHSICKPLAEAEELASAIAKGDLTNVDRPIEGKDEASHLLHSLQLMQKALQDLVGQLRTSADHIRTASVEIASGNQDLSGRTEQTASNLQLAASSMVQLTGTVKQTADSARTANQLASSASSAAAKGGEVVGQVVSTMDEINASSKRIGDIIGVIDGIAFQTNILALNAAVEAARAGEQGRGFAVVAGEVRSLAQRSAGAAREIKTLIGASVERVETGARLVQEAGESMTDIVSSVQRVTDIIGEITAAASEQSDGIGQVNQSVVELDQMTQQNAALVEESAAAAESLRDQAEQLAQAVGKFKIAGDHAPVATASKPRRSTSPSPRPTGSSLARPGITATSALAAKAAPAPLRPAVASGPRPSAPMPAPKAAPSRPAAPAGDSDWESF